MSLQHQLSLLAPPRVEREYQGRQHAISHDTEQLAAARQEPRAGTLRARVLEVLRARGDRGATDYELWRERIGARPHVAATRREELQRDGWPIADSGRRRETDTGSSAIVWVLSTS